MVANMALSHIIDSAENALVVDSCGKSTSCLSLPKWCLSLPKWCLSLPKWCLQTAISAFCVCRPTGAVRVSFGWMSSLQDAQAILTFLQTCFLNTAGYNPSPGVNTSPSLITSDSRQEASEKPGQQPLRLDAHCSHAVQHSIQQQQLRPAAVSNTVSQSQASNSVSDFVTSGVTAAEVCAAVTATTSASGNVEMCQDDAEQKLSEQLPNVAKKLPQMTQDTSSDQRSNTEAGNAVTGSHSHHDDASQEAGKAAAASAAYAWLQQLPWVRCGDTVTAWTASGLQTQRLRSHSQAGLSGQKHDSQLHAQDRTKGSSGGSPGQEPLHPQAALSSQHASASNSDSQTLTHQQSAPSAVHSDHTVNLSLNHSSACSPGSQSDSTSDPLSDSHAGQGSLEGIWVYPIKSCGGVRVSEWPLGPNGLLLDREWALIGDDGCVLTQKGLPKLALIQPKIDLAQGLLQVCKCLTVASCAA